jgi:uncharacterized membrane protein
MRNYIAVVFSNKTKAYEGLHGFWQLDDLGEITVHGTAVIHRDALGQVLVDTKETHPVLATAVGVGVGALLGLFAGPAGIAIGVAAGVAVGAATRSSRSSRPSRGSAPPWTRAPGPASSTADESGRA